MAAHVRTSVRQAIVAALIAGGTDAGAHVFDSRVTALQRTELPALVVRTPSESQSNLTMGAPVAVMQRAARLEIEAVVAQNDGYAEALDRLIAQVETLIAANCFAASAKQIYPTDYQEIGDADGDVITVKGTQAFQVFYNTSQAAPGIAL